MSQRGLFNSNEITQRFALFSEEIWRESIWHDVAEAGDPQIALEIGGVEWDLWACELGDDLAAETARWPGIIGVGDDGDFGDFDFAGFAHGFENRRALSADGSAVRRVLDVAAGEDFAVF
jgi:hypothetical protein